MSEIIIIVLLIAFNGLLSMSEISLVSVRKTFLANEEKNGKKAAKMALRLTENPDHFLSTVQIGITMIGILTGIYSGDVLAADFTLVLVRWGVPISYSHLLSQTLIVALVTYFTIIFGELVPKRIGMGLAGKVAMGVAYPMYWLSVIGSPFVWLLTYSTRFITKHINLEGGTGKVTEEEIKSIIDEGKKVGEVLEEEQNIMERVFLLGDLHAAALMTHRNDLIYLSPKMSIDKIYSILDEHPFDVFPVTVDDLYEVKGIAYLKDVAFGIQKEDFKLESLIKPSLYVPENMSVFKVLELMKQKRIKHALVCDEFGSFQGLITLTDILESLVGAIEEPFEEPNIIKCTDCEEWLIDGKCPFHDFLTYFELEYLYSNVHYNTIAGLLLEQLGHIPQSGEFIVWNGLKLMIVDMDGARIDKVMVSWVNPEE